MSRFSVASRISRYDDETISTTRKRRYDLPKLKVDRLDTDYNNIIQGQIKVPSISKSVVSSNKLPSHLRGSNFYIRTPNNVNPLRDKKIRHSQVNKSLHIINKNSLLSSKKRYDVDPSTEISLNKKLNQKYNTARKKPPVDLPSPQPFESHQIKTLEMRRREADQAILRT
jgi:hypothetical protein